MRAAVLALFLVGSLVFLLQTISFTSTSALSISALLSGDGSSPVGATQTAAGGTCSFPPGGRDSVDMARARIVAFRDVVMDGGRRHSSFPDSPKPWLVHYADRPEMADEALMRAHGLLVQPLALFLGRYRLDESTGSWAIGSQPGCAINPFAQLLAVGACIMATRICPATIADAALNRDVYEESSRQG